MCTFTGTRVQARAGTVLPLLVFHYLAVNRQIRFGKAPVPSTLRHEPAAAVGSVPPGPAPCVYVCARMCAFTRVHERVRWRPHNRLHPPQRSLGQCFLEPGRWHWGEGEGHTLCSARPLSPEVSRAPSSWGRQTRAVHSVAGAPSRSRSQRAVSGVGERTAFSAAVENSLRVILVKARPASINRNFQSVLKVREWIATTNKTQTPPSVCWGSQNDLLGNL